jgi:hypothetical protein
MDFLRLLQLALFVTSASFFQGKCFMRILKLRCKFCGYWNRFPVNKVLVEQNSPEHKVKVFIPMYLPLQVSKCEKCGELIAQPKELIKIVKSAEI